MPSSSRRRASQAWDAFSQGRWWRPLLALPKALYGLAVMAGVGAFYAQWVGASIAAVLWLAGSLIALARPGERWFLEISKWHPIQLEREFGTGVRDELEAVVGKPQLTAYDFYVIDLDLPTALAVGGHSIGVTTLLLDLYRNDRILQEHVVAVLLHEMGHHRRGSIRFAALETYLVLPWTWTRILIKALTAGAAEALRSSVIAVVFLGLALILALQVLQVLVRPHLVLVVTTATVSAAAVLLLAALHGSLSRAEELRADAFAAAHGYGPSLIAYLQWIDHNAQETPPSWWSRLARSHPPIGERITHLEQLLG